MPTLSGGEAQRIRLAAQLGSNLSGVLYILDEPTIGLHARDNEQLLAALEKLKARGNSVLVVEHDEATMRRADYIIDLGPGAGRARRRSGRGGHAGRAAAAPGIHHRQMPAGAEAVSDAREAKADSPKAEVRSPSPKCSNEPTTSAATIAGGGWLTLRGASKNNLKNLTVRFPLGRLVVVTGVSGSGKSTLIRECLLARAQITPSRTTQHAPRTHSHQRLTGCESLQAVYEVDQSPIGRTPRSIPATYVGFFDDIRQLFAQVPEARLRGYSPSRFSFNSAQGRCPECEGRGHDQAGDELPAARLRALRSLRRHAVQPRDARHRIPRQERRRGAGVVGGGGPGVLCRACRGSSAPCRRCATRAWVISSSARPAPRSAAAKPSA